MKNEDNTQKEQTEGAREAMSWIIIQQDKRQLDTIRARVIEWGNWRQGWRKVHVMQTEGFGECQNRWKCMEVCKEVPRSRNQVAEVGFEYFCLDYVSKNGVSVTEHNSIPPSRTSSQAPIEFHGKFGLGLKFGCRSYKAGAVHGKSISSFVLQCLCPKRSPTRLWCPSLTSLWCLTGRMRSCQLGGHHKGGWGQVEKRTGKMQRHGITKSCRRNKSRQIGRRWKGSVRRMQIQQRQRKRWMRPPRKKAQCSLQW